MVLLLILIYEKEVLDPGCGFWPYGYLIHVSSGSKGFEDLSLRPTYFQHFIGVKLGEGSYKWEIFILSSLGFCKWPPLTLVSLNPLGSNL